MKTLTILATLTALLLVPGCGSVRLPLSKEQTSSSAATQAAPPAAPATLSQPASPPAPPPVVAPQPLAEPVDAMAVAAAEEEPKDPLPAEALAKPPASFEGDGWEAMFNGESLTGWRQVDFAGGGEVEIRAGIIRLHMGEPFTGIQYTNPFPKLNFEVAFDAMRFMGNDFFCGLTVPMGTNHFTLIVGGWGGGLVGISSLDGMDAAENETTKFMNFERGKWYRVRLRSTENRIEAWIDDEKKIDVVTKERRVAMRPGEIEKLAPMGIASWQTGSAIREIRMRTVSGPADPLKAWQR